MSSPKHLEICRLSVDISGVYVQPASSKRS